MQQEASVGKNIYAGLFMVTLATLSYEILMTRIFSVTMWYHFAFVAISVAMFGMTVGAILVYLFPNYFSPEMAARRLGLYSLLFAASLIVCFLLHLQIPFGEPTSFRGLESLALTYVLISVPFTFSGICVCLALTKFSRRVGGLYAADLAGAGLGCIAVIYILNLTDGPTAVIVVAFLASLGTLFFVAGQSSRMLKAAALACAILLGAVSATQSVLVARQHRLFRLKWVKGAPEDKPLYDKWNSFSRVSVWGNPDFQDVPFGWGFSAAAPQGQTVRQLFVTIDSAAGTVMTHFDGNTKGLEYLKYDVTNLAHYLRPNADVLVVGSGGGRDVLSGIVFGQKSVLAVEINNNMINAVNRSFGDFTGHLDRYPNVSFVNDEARSFIARQKKQFDILQISLIDTWAATAAGAFILTENSLYTVEAWKTFLEHLSPRGVLTVSRWYSTDTPLEVYRLTSLASAALARLGVESPRKQILIVKNRVPENTPNAPSGVGTMLLSRQPFSDQDIDAMEELAKKMKFDLVLTPRFAADSTFETLASGKDLDRFTAQYSANIAPPTDDAPFFFQMLRLRDLKDLSLFRPGSHLMFNLGAVVVLGALMVIVFVLTLLCVVVPLTIKTGRASLRGAAPLAIYFSCIGFGFMLVEISQMQRLIVFLGHPTYGLSVVLFTLLLSGGLGSYLTGRIDPAQERSGNVHLCLLLCVLALFGKFTPLVTPMFQGSTTLVRISIAVGILFCLGMFMGMAFPLGLKVASLRSSALTPWLWGINGATSVCGSVLAVVISLNWGIAAAFWTGFFCYAFAFLCFVGSRREQPKSLPEPVPLAV